jgi:hypothetical protein
MCQEMFLAQHLSCGLAPFPWSNFDYIGWQKKNVSLPVEIHGDSYSCDIAESEYGNQIARHPAVLWGRD